jgi:ABC transporter substrate binding protein
MFRRRRTWAFIRRSLRDWVKKLADDPQHAFPGQGQMKPDKVASMRVPAIYPFREYVQSGGLVSYGANLPDMYRRAANYVDKILKGDKPGELPLQSAERFELLRRPSLADPTPPG